MIEVMLPGSDVWQKREEIPPGELSANVVGTLVKYPSGLVLRVAGIDEGADGQRYMKMEVNTPTESA
jgi:hypothetical protein